MKKQLRLLAFFSTGLLTTTGGILVACSSDDTVTPNPGTDSGYDVNPPDSGGGDTGTDTGADVDSGFDGGFKVDTFPAQIADELCKALARCCYGTETPGDGGADGGTFSTDECKAFYLDYGFEGSNVGHKFVEAGAITVEQVNADSCISKIKAASCNLAGTDFEAIRSACFAAYAGTLAAGSACHDSIECASGNYCVPDAAAPGGDGGVIGACAALNGLGASCAQNTGNIGNDIALAELSCSWRVSGQPNNHCTWYDPDAGDIADAGDWKCATAVSAGSGCAASNWCNASICNNDSLCETPNYYWAPTCSRFVH